MAVSFTAITGFIVFAGNLNYQLIILALGVFILAGGASALNEYQEYAYDAKMQRTQSRPIPTGKLTLQQALIISLLFIFFGSIILYYFFGLTTCLLGLFNVLWYNLLYTNLKRITPFAVVPGSLTGAIPVLMGWTAAGGFLFDKEIVFIAFFIFIWQIPHFWLLMLKYGKDYEAAGFPTINQTVSSRNLKRIIFSWIISTSFASIMVPAFLENISLILFVSIFVLNILFVAIFAIISFGKMEEIDFKKSFVGINIYMFLFMMILTLYHLLG